MSGGLPLGVPELAGIAAAISLLLAVCIVGRRLRRRHATTGYEEVRASKGLGSRDGQPGPRLRVSFDFDGRIEDGEVLRTPALDSFGEMQRALLRVAGEILLDSRADAVDQWRVTYTDSRGERHEISPYDSDFYDVREAAVALDVRLAALSRADYVGHAARAPPQDEFEMD